LAAGQFRLSLGTLVMLNLKNLARRKASQAMHNNEDARVIEAAPPQKPKGRIAWIKAKAVTLLKWIARIRLCIWLWEKAVEGWDFVEAVVIPFVENIL
jgi:hypothetical protein